MDQKQQFSIWYVLNAVLVLVSMQNYLGRHTETLAYSDFKALLAAGKLENLTVSEVDIRGTVRTRVQDAFEQAKTILCEHRDTLEQGAELLLKQETLTEPELAAIQQTLPMAAAHAEPPEDAQ